MVGQDPVELAARIDVELLEHLAQVVVDRVRAEEERAATCWLVKPSLAKPATLASCDVSSSERRRLLFGGRPPVADSSVCALLANARAPIVNIP
jgi:hypothetical protein